MSLGYKRNQCLPISNGIFDVVASSIDEDTTLIPRTTLDMDVLVHSAKAIYLTVTD